MNARVFTSISDLFFIAYGCFTLSGITCYFLGFTLTMMLASTVVAAALSTWLVLGKWECESRFSPISKSDVVSLSSFVLLAVLFTLCLDRPDADDEGYLGLVAMALDYVHLPLQDIPTGVNKGYSLSYFETFQATITYLTGILLLVSYYFVAPSILAVFSILIHWRVLDN